MYESTVRRPLARFAAVAFAAAALAAVPTPAQAGRPVSAAHPIVVHPRPHPPAAHYRPYYGYGAYWGWGPAWGWWGSPYWWGPSVVAVYDQRPSGPPRHAVVKTDVTPEEAEVYLDGQYIGRADDFDGFPDVLYLGPGAYRLEFRHPLHEPLLKEIDARAGAVIRIDKKMSLAPGKGKLDAFDPPDRGTPLGRVFHKTATGTLEKGDPVEAPPPPEPAEVERIPEDAPRESAEGGTPPPTETVKKARIRFDVSPRDAAVYLDDRYLGAADELLAIRRGLVVSPGKHTVTVVRPGYTPQTVTVDVGPGESDEVEVELER